MNGTNFITYSTFTGREDTLPFSLCFYFYIRSELNNFHHDINLGNKTLALCVTKFCLKRQLNSSENSLSPNMERNRIETKGNTAL